MLRSTDCVFFLFQCVVLSAVQPPPEWTSTSARVACKRSYVMAARLRDSVVLVLLSIIICSRNIVFAENGTRAEMPTLHLLALVPMTETVGLPYQRGQDLVSAAQLAVDQINMRDDILSGYELELVPADEGSCNQSLVTEALVNFVRLVPNGVLNIVGVVGLACSAATQAVSAFAGRPEIDLLQISAGATSPVFTSEEEYPRLYRMISSSAVYNDAVLALMDTFQWRRISVVRDNIVIQYITTADDFLSKVESRAELDIVYLGYATPRFPTSSVQRLLPEAALIIYASVTVFEARELLCESYRKDIRWPEFVWLFHDISLDDLVNGTGTCNNETMLRAVEGVFLLQYKFNPDPNATLVSGQAYSEYLSQLRNRTAGMQENQHADAMYDSIWAFALALNNLTSEELESFSPGLDNNVTAIVEGHLKDLRFSGALGNIVFSEQREVVTKVDIFHVREGEAIYTGQYNPLTGNITDLLFPEMIPNDDFETVNILLSPAHFIVTYTVVIALLIFTTVILVIFIYHWNKPSIKASSPILSLLIFAGCYMLYTVCLLAGASNFNVPIFGSNCLAQVWFGATGVQLIYSVLFMRLLRIYRIFFFVFKKPGKLWSNHAMVALSFVPVSMTILLMIIWTVSDPIVTGYTTPVLDMTSDPPRYTRNIFCRSNQLIVWLSVVLYGVNGVTIIGVIVLSTLTRKVHLDCFRDTKQVNLFVLSTVACLFVWLPYTVLFTNYIVIPDAAQVFSILPYLIIPFLCKLLLFIPKIWSARHERKTLRRKPHIRVALAAMHTNRKSASSFPLHKQCSDLDVTVSTV